MLNLKKAWLALTAAVTGLIVSGSASAYTVTGLDIQPITDSVTANVAIIVPAAFGLLVVMVSANKAFSLVKTFFSKA